MSNGNPFYVQPAGDYSAGLTGLARSISDVGRRKQAIRRVNELKAGALQAFQTGDPRAMMEFSMANPEMASAMKSGIAFTNKKTEDNYFQSAVSLINDPNPANVERVIASRQEIFANTEVEDPELTDGFKDRLAADPEGTIEKLKVEVPLMFPNRYKAYRDAIGTAAKKVTPYTSMGKLNTDYMNGVISKDTFVKERDKIEQPTFPPKSNHNGKPSVPKGALNLWIGKNASPLCRPTNRAILPALTIWNHTSACPPRSRPLNAPFPTKNPKSPRVSPVK